MEGSREGRGRKGREAWREVRGDKFQCVIHVILDGLS